MAEGAIQELATLFARLPGVGKRTATRLVFHLLDANPEYVKRLGECISGFRDRVRHCELCGNVSEQSPCEICANPARDNGIICVVESIPDLWAVESGGTFRGHYHVLHGLLSPLDGVGPDDLNLPLLRHSATIKGTREVIVATRPSVEGEATALLIRQTLADLDVTVSRIAAGIPHGSEIEYIDSRTLERALDDRKKMV